MRDRWYISIHWSLFYALTSIPLPSFPYEPEAIIEYILLEWLKNYRDEMEDGLRNLDSYIDHYEHTGKESFERWLKKFREKSENCKLGENPRPEDEDNLRP